MGAGARRSVGSCIWRQQSSPGYTLIEVLVAMSVFGVLVGTALPHYHANRLQLGAAHQQLVAALRDARGLAVSHNLHFAVEVTGADQIVVQRLRQVGTAWESDGAPLRTLRLQSPSSVAPGMVGVRVEFNGRGAAVNLATPQRIDLRDTFGATKSLQIWPSGEINVS